MEYLYQNHRFLSNRAGGFGGNGDTLRTSKQLVLLHLLPICFGYPHRAMKRLIPARFGQL